MIKGTIHRLGAEHLVELGRRRDKGPAKRPALLGMPRLDGPRDVVGYLGQTLVAGLDLTAQLIGAPRNLFGQGQDYVATNTAAILGEVPAIGELIAAVLLTGNAVLHYRIPVNGIVPVKLTTSLQGLERAMQVSFDAETRRSLLDAAREQIVSQAPEKMRGDVLSFLASASENLT